MSHTGSAAMCHGTAVTTRRTTASADRQLMPVPAVVRLGSHPVALWCSRAAAPQRAAVDSADAHRCARVMPRTQHPTSTCTKQAHTHDGRQARRRRSTRRRRPNVGCSARTRRTPNAGLARAHAGTNQQHIKSTAPRAPATVAHSVCSCSSCAGAFTLVCAVNKASRRSQHTLRTPRAPKALGVTRSVTPRRSDRASTPASPRTRPRG